MTPKRPTREAPAAHLDTLLEALDQARSETRVPLGSEPHEGVIERLVRQPYKDGLRKWLQSPELRELIASWTPLDRPEFWGHMTPPPVDHLWLADLLISKTNQNLVKLETALGSTTIERVLAREVASWIWGDAHVSKIPFSRADLPAPTVFTSGGTLANLTALWTARNHLLAEARQKGIRGGSLEIWVSERGHYSIQKAADVLGLGRRAVRRLPVDRDHRIDMRALEAMARKRRKNTRVILIGVAGSTETGSIDPLAELARFAKREGAWFHVDAAWGGGLLLHPDGKLLFKGIEGADSVTMDGHKLLFTTMGLGMVCFKDPRRLQAIASEAQYILRPGSADLGRFSIEGSRPFHAFRLFWVLATEGRAKLAARLEHSLKLTREIAQWLETQRDLELTSPVATNLLTYRFVPIQWRDARIKPAILSARLEALQIEVQEAQRTGGQHFVSRTRLRGLSPLPNIESTVLRIVPGHPEQTLDLFRQCIAEQREIVERNLKRQTTPSLKPVSCPRTKSTDRADKNSIL